MTEIKRSNKGRTVNQLYKLDPSMKESKNKAYSTTRTITESSGIVTKGSRTNFRKNNLKKLALKIKKYGELEHHEVQIKNTLCIQPNYNAGFGFELLNPLSGIVDVKRLHNEMRSNFKIALVEKSIVEDIIGRLGYVNDNEILLSDMTFFEPSRSDPSFTTYRRNFRTDQDESDITWHRLYKEIWKALINTVKQRRIIQNEMNDNYPDAIDYMFEESGIPKNDKFTKEDIEDFITEQLKSRLDPELLKCIIQTLDRDQDGLVSYQEF